MTGRPIIVLIKVHARKGKGEVARRAFEKLIATVKLEEKDCLAIRLHQSLDDPELLMLHEQWTSRSAYEGLHMKTRHMQAFVETAMQFLVGPPEISFWDEVDLG